MKKIIECLQLQPELIDYLDYLVKNHTNYQHDSGYWEKLARTQIVEKNKEYLCKLISLGLVREVEHSYDVDFTGLQEHDRMIIGYQLTDVGKEIYKQLKIGGKK